MNVARHVIFIVCLMMAIICAGLTGQRHLSAPENQLLEVVFGAVLILTAIGILGFVTQFFARRTSRVLLSVFFGFLAGIMVTNFVCEIISGTTYSSLSGYVTSYGLMLLFLSLAVIGLVLLQIQSSSGLQTMRSRFTPSCQTPDPMESTAPRQNSESSRG